MWSRKELKERSKIRMHANYWKCILVALVLTFIVGLGFGSSGGGGSDSASHNSAAEAYTGFSSPEANDFFSDPADYMKDTMEHIDRFTEAEQISIAGIILVAVVFAIVILVVVAVLIFLLKVFVLNPIEIGCNRFFHKNLNEDASVKEICYAFDNSYKNNMKIMFFRSLYTLLWTLLFIIPGIVKSYEYRMIPYILGENPYMDKDAAFALSKQMMYGNKWKAFVLDLSFIGWEILSALTLGILGIFYVNPYYYQTDAALYEALKAPAAPENF